MDEGTKIPNHLNAFNDWICQLTSLDEKSNEEEKTISLLCTLLDSQNHVITSTWFSNSEDFDYENVIGAFCVKICAGEIIHKKKQQLPQTLKVGLENVGIIHEMLLHLNQELKRGS